LTSWESVSSQELCSMEWVPITRTSHIYVSKDMRIRGHFSKPKGVLQQKRLGNTEWSCICIRVEGKLGVGWGWRCSYNLGTRQRWVISLTSSPLYFPETSSRYPLNWALGWPQSRSGHLKLHTAETFLRSYQALNYSRNSAHVIEHEGSLPHSQQPATCFLSWARSIQSMLPTSLLLRSML